MCEPALTQACSNMYDIDDIMSVPCLGWSRPFAYALACRCNCDLHRMCLTGIHLVYCFIASVWWMLQVKLRSFNRLQALDQGSTDTWIYVNTPTFGTLMLSFGPH